MRYRVAYLTQSSGLQFTEDTYGTLEDAMSVAVEIMECTFHAYVIKA